VKFTLTHSPVDALIALEAGSTDLKRVCLIIKLYAADELTVHKTGWKGKNQHSLP